MAQPDPSLSADHGGEPDPRRARLWVTLSLACLGLLAVSLTTGLLVPIYTDEVTSRFQLSRLPFDGGFDRFVAEACGPNTIARPPFFMLPFRYLSAYVNLVFDRPEWVRLAGVATALVWIGLVWRLLGRVGGSLTVPLRVLAVAILGFGVQPYLLVWGRPEQILLLTITFALTVALRRDPQASARSRNLASALILLSGLVALSYHLKGVVFLPVFMAAAALSSSGKEGRAGRWAAVALLAGAGALALSYWTRRFSCPADSILAAQLGSQNLGAMFLAYGRHDLHGLAQAALKNVSPLEYVKVALPARSYMSDWLPPVETLLPALKAWRLSIRLSWVLALVLFAVTCVAGLWSALKARRLAPELGLALVLLAATLVWSASQMVKNAYEATIVLPMLLVSGLLILSSIRPGRLGRRAVAAAAVTVAAVSNISQVLLAAEYAPRLAAVARQPGYIADQPFSFVPWGYGALAPKIAAAGKMCGLDPASRPKGVLIDDVTYFAFMDAYRPQHRLGVLSTWNGAQDDPVRYLNAKQSRGMVVGCRYLPPALRERAKADGEFCCVSLP